jgi:ribonuclease J
MGLIRQYLKQKVARTFSDKNIDIDVVKKEIRDEITHILYDQTRRTPIVIPVINEIGGGRPQTRANEQAGRPLKASQNVSTEPRIPDVDIIAARPKIKRPTY